MTTTTSELTRPRPGSIVTTTNDLATLTTFQLYNLLQPHQTIQTTTATFLDLIIPLEPDDEPDLNEDRPIIITSDKRASS